jgi:hypothetical protein
MAAVVVAMSGALVKMRVACARTGRASMSTEFEKARLSFTEYAAHTLGVDRGTIQVIPVDVEVAIEDKLRVGKLWQFEASGDRFIGGWATDDGTVVTPEQNLGMLLEESGVWTPHSTTTALDLAKHIAWAMDHQLLNQPDRKAALPTLHLEKNGAGVLRFFTGYRPPGTGPLQDVYECTVTLTNKHTAKLTKKLRPA